jgi:hypothetical protein
MQLSGKGHSSVSVTDADEVAWELQRERIHMENFRERRQIKVLGKLCFDLSFLRNLMMMTA